MADLPPDADVRVEAYARGADFGPVADALAAHREEILARWLAVTCRQKFHDCRHEAHVADHIPALFDALLALLRREAPRWTVAAPLDDPAVLAAARAHARDRFAQGLEAAQIATEFRLLRQEVGRALRAHLADTTPTDDLLGAELLLHDALDGAITLALDALTQRVEEVRAEFLATTVHDVAQPLSSIKANFQLLRRGLERGGEPAKLIETAQRGESEVDRLAALLGTLTEASRLTLGRLQPRPASVDLAALVRGAVTHLAPEDAARVRLDLPPEGAAEGQWDAALLDRAAANLLSNALKYSREGAPVHVAVRARPAEVELTVRDEGIGLEPDELVGLFRRYGRTGGAATEGIQGLGLGLYLTKGIVEAHDGLLRAESPGRGRGATFRLVLPRAATARTELAP